MNLIEQLGGYEKAKDFLNISKGAEWIGVFYMPKLKQALLQYRREHNIFEVGDAIIRRWNGRLYWIITDVDNGSEFMISENKNAKFKNCKVCDFPSNFTHATDEEIEAGKRL